MLLVVLMCVLLPPMRPLSLHFTPSSSSPIRMQLKGDLEEKEELHHPKGGQEVEEAAAYTHLVAEAAARGIGPMYSCVCVCMSGKEHDFCLGRVEVKKRRIVVVQRVWR